MLVVCKLWECTRFPVGGTFSLSVNIRMFVLR